MKLIKDATKEKLRGGFYTPKKIADFVLKWALSGRENSDILEPSCGDGAFLRAIQASGINYKSVTAIEFDADEAQKAKAIKLKNTKIIHSDFHDFCIHSRKRFDVVVGNPPFIRYQFFDKSQQAYAAEIFSKAGMTYSKLTNAWVSFVVGSSLLLKEKGKIAFVLPAEILQVTYAKTLREFLSKFYNKINIISFEKLVFPSIQQEVVLLLCEKDGSNRHVIDHIELTNADCLSSLTLKRLDRPNKKIDFAGNKWTLYFLNQKEISLIERLQKDTRLNKLGSFANVEVGITTGSNPFFTVPLSTVEDYSLHDYAKPLVGRSVQVPSAIFNKRDWRKNRNSEARTHLLTFPPKEELKGASGALRYIAQGEQDEIHLGYKCRIRPQWQIVPSLRVSQALFIRRNHRYPKLIVNKAKAFTTDTMHRVTVNEGVNVEAFTASYYNSISLAFSEICGRSHGGGVLELMPNEVEEIILPYSDSHAHLLKEVDKKLRAKKPIEDILEITNKIILKDTLGFTYDEIATVHGIWVKLSQRRLNRE